MRFERLYMRKDGEEKTGGAVVAESEDASLFVALGVTAKLGGNLWCLCTLFPFPPFAESFVFSSPSRRSSASGTEQNGGTESCACDDARACSGETSCVAPFTDPSSIGEPAVPTTSDATPCMWRQVY
jgi:hypothetical protein